VNNIVIIILKISQKAVLFILAAMRTWNLTQIFWFLMLVYMLIYCYICIHVYCNNILMK
jgi:hypothetical protein